MDGAIWNNGSNKSFHRLVLLLQFSNPFYNENSSYYILEIEENG